MFHWQLFFETVRQDHNKNKLTKGAHLKQVVNKACRNVKNCMMTTTPSFKLGKVVNKKE
jgi:hypothetical protein